MSWADWVRLEQAPTDWGFIALLGIWLLMHKPVLSWMERRGWMDWMDERRWKDAAE